MSGRRLRSRNINGLVGAFLSASAVLCHSILDAAFVFAQTSPPSPRTVGDGTVFMLQPGRSESYGTTSGDIGGSNFGQPMFQRNDRWGSNTGIGSSGLQTQSATAGDSPNLINRSPNGVSSSALARPDLNHSFLALPGSPALGGINSGAVESFAFARSFGSRPGALSGSGLTSSYATSANTLYSGQLAPSPGLFQDMDTIPSFSRHRTGSALPMSGSGDAAIFKGLGAEF